VSVLSFVRLVSFHARDRALLVWNAPVEKTFLQGLSVLSISAVS